MRITLFIMALMAFCHIGHAQKKALTDLERQKLKGNVRSLIEVKYRMADSPGGMISDSAIFQRYAEFGIDGYESISSNYENGEISRTFEYFYDGEGRQYAMKEFNAAGDLHCIVNYTHNDKGFKDYGDYEWIVHKDYEDNLIKNDFVFVIFEYYPYVKVRYEHEYRGYCTLEEFIQADGKVIYTYEHRYDAHGNKISMIYLNALGHTSWVTKYKYDRYNNLIESKVYKSNYVALETTYDYEFDGMGNWVKRLEKRKVYRNILTQSILDGNILTERQITYY